MATAAQMPSSRSKPEISIVIQSQVFSQSETVGIDIPLLGLSLEELTANSTDRLKASLPNGLISLEISVRFRILGESVSILANIVGESIESIRITQQSAAYVQVQMSHRKSSKHIAADDNCTLQCAKGRPISSSGHCIDCAGPRGIVRLCC